MGTDLLGTNAKVVISPDEMRAWVKLPQPPKGVKYTVEAIMEWLPRNGVVFGADEGLINEAIYSKKYDDLLEVARGLAPQAGTAGKWNLRVEKRAFTGLKGSSDGSLFYDDLSFLQEVQPGQVLAELTSATKASPGRTVKGEEVQAKDGAEDTPLTGSGFEVSPDGTQYISPCLGHISFVGEQLIVTPLLKLEGLCEEDGPVEFDGNVLVEGDVLPGSSITATGSVFVAGRAAGATIDAGRNVLLCSGMRSQGAFGTIKAKENVWGLSFEAVDINAGGDVQSNLLAGCEVIAGGRASILGGRASITSSNVFAKNGVVAGQLGSTQKERMTIAVGMDASQIDHFDNLEAKIAKLGVDIQALQQSINAMERINRMKPDKGRNEPKYKELVQKRDQSLSVLNILDKERTRNKRIMESFSNVSVVVRGTAYPGVTVVIDTRELTLKIPFTKVKFRRSGEMIDTSLTLNQ